MPLHDALPVRLEEADYLRLKKLEKKKRLTQSEILRTAVVMLLDLVDTHGWEAVLSGLESDEQLTDEPAIRPPDSPKGTPT